MRKQKLCERVVLRCSASATDPGGSASEDRMSIHLETVERRRCQVSTCVKSARLLPLRRAPPWRGRPSSGRSHKREALAAGSEPALRTLYMTAPSHPAPSRSRDSSVRSRSRPFAYAVRVGWARRRAMYAPDPSGGAPGRAACTRIVEMGSTARPGAMRLPGQYLAFKAIARVDT